MTDGNLDGFEIGYVPDGAGENVSDFTSEWEDVTIATRVWERTVAEGFEVDLRVHVLRGPRLAGAAELSGFLAEYHERDPASWTLDDYWHGESPGFIGDSEVFWLPEPGVGVEVRFAPGRFDGDELRAVAAGVRPVGAS